MGLYRQPNDWTCGPFALKHALVALGRLADEDSIAQVAHPHWWGGTDEVKLARAARHFECDLPFLRRRDADAAYHLLRRYTEQAIPVILCIDEWGHWITVVRHEDERFVVIDSNDDPVLKVMTWPQLRNRWCFVDYDDYDWKRDAYPHYYDLHPVKPRFSVPVKAHFSVERAQFLRRSDNAELAQHWDDYLGDLMDICRPRQSRSSANVAMSTFLARNEDSLVSRLRHWHGYLESAAIKRVLRNFRFVAETYDMRISERGMSQALMDFSMLLAMWASASYGVDDMYGSDDNADAARCRSRRR